MVMEIQNGFQAELKSVTLFFQFFMAVWVHHGRGGACWVVYGGNGWLVMVGC